MPDDEGKTQNDENNDFSGMTVFYRRTADDGDEDHQNGLEYVRFFEERLLNPNEKAISFTGNRVDFNCAFAFMTIIPVMMAKGL